MKRLLVLGAGTGGTIVANRMRRQLSASWRISVVDPSLTHLYQPGLLFVPFGGDDSLQRSRAATLAPGVDWIRDSVVAVNPDARRVALASAGYLPYDVLVVASGARLRPDLTPGLEEALKEGRAHDFYTLSGARRLRAALEQFTGGRLVVNVVEMPIKCPVAPLEFLFLADAYFREHGRRDGVELVYATPLDGAFTRPLASRLLGRMLEERGIRVEAEFATSEVDGQRRTLASWDGRSLSYDLLVSIPTHSGMEFVERSGLGNELAFVRVDPRTLAISSATDAFALGDATDAPASKAGSVAHFQADGLEENLLRAIASEEPVPIFDGHANCFVETGGGKALLIDFSYDLEPVPGRYPNAWGPFSLMRASWINHLGKLAFRPIYWELLLRGARLPVPSRMSTRGKKLADASLTAMS